LGPKTSIKEGGLEEQGAKEDRGLEQLVKHIKAGNLVEFKKESMRLQTLTADVNAPSLGGTITFKFICRLDVSTLCGILQ
jgi:hypothetical protein